MVVQVKKGAFSPGTRGSQLSENEADYLAVDKADNKADHWADRRHSLALQLKIYAQYLHIRIRNMQQR